MLHSNAAVIYPTDFASHSQLDNWHLPQVAKLHTLWIQPILKGYILTSYHESRCIIRKDRSVRTTDYYHYTTCGYYSTNNLWENTIIWKQIDVAITSSITSVLLQSRSVLVFQTHHKHNFSFANDGFIFALYLTYMQPSTFKHKVSIEGVSREVFISSWSSQPTNRLSD